VPLLRLLLTVFGTRVALPGRVPDCGVTFSQSLSLVRVHGPVVPLSSEKLISAGEQMRH
jgi:hypothetical protein